MFSAGDGPDWPLCILKTAQLSRGGLPKEQEEQEEQEGLQLPKARAADEY